MYRQLVNERLCSCDDLTVGFHLSPFHVERLAGYRLRHRQCVIYVAGHNGSTAREHVTKFRSSALEGLELQHGETSVAAVTVRSGSDQNCPSSSLLCRPSARRASLSYSSATLRSLHLDVSSSIDSAFSRVASARPRQCLASENRFFCFMQKRMQCLDQENATRALRKIP